MKNEANNLTKGVVAYLNGSGYVAWRNNNNAVYDSKLGIFRKNPTAKLGVCDVIGFRKSDGKFIGVEVKVGHDKLSPEQVQHHEEMRQGGCMLVLAHDIDQFIKDTIDEEGSHSYSWIPHKAENFLGGNMPEECQRILVLFAGAVRKQLLHK